jgi:F-type H+-transporting ATPase subunit b
MNILDVRQLTTQILGFLIVLWILGRYAWPQVLGFIEARRERIATDLRNAESERQQATQLKEDLGRELRSIESKARARIQEAVGEGQKVATEIKSNAQSEATARLQRLAEEIEQEREKAMVVLKQDLVRITVGTAERVLREKLDEKTQRRLTEEFIAEVGAAGGAPGAAD